MSALKAKIIFPEILRPGDVNLCVIKNWLMKRLLAFSILLQVSHVCLAQNNKIPVLINNPGKQFELIGQLGEKLGSTLTVRGMIVEGPSKGYEDGPNLVVQVINDSSTQQPVQIPVSPYFGEFGKNALPALKNGATYRLRVYETGEFVGTPPGAYKEAGISLQTSGFYFRNRLIVISAEKIDPIGWSPASFVGQNALLSGVAKNENDTAVIQTAEWKLRLIGSGKWTDAEIGKLAEVYGNIRETKTKGVYNVENARPRLVRLEDQLGKTVKLRGTAISMNGHWWFNYRGIDMYVEKMEELPDWTADNHFRPLEITGILEQAEFPDIDQLSVVTNPGLKTYYIVRKASWIPIAGLLAPELPH
jgi:hypothetical protein